MSGFSRFRSKVFSWFWMTGAILGVVPVIASMAGAASLDQVPSVSYLQAVEAYKGHSYREASQLFQAFIEKNPNNGDAYYFLGLTSQELKDHEKAVSSFGKVLEFNHDRRDVYLPLAISLYHLQKFEEARLAFSKVLENDPTSANAHFFIGMIYLKQKKIPFCRLSSGTSGPKRVSRSGCGA